MDNYTVIKQLGAGCFGAVYLAQRRENGAVVALKRIPTLRLQEGLPTVICREVAALRRLREELYVVRLWDVFAHGSAVILVMELCQGGSLADLLRAHLRASLSKDLGHLQLTLAQRKRLVVMVLQGVKACHAAGILHRDIKPGNFLLSTALGHLKLSDFGLARPAKLPDQRDDYTHEVATRWYRAPELLLGARQYGTAVDMWSVGCVAAEILGEYHSAVFQGVGDLDQLNKVFRVLGTPSAETWPTVDACPDWHKVEFTPIPVDSCGGVKSLMIDTDLSELGVDFVAGLLRLDPARRPSAEACLSHPFFDEVPLPAPVDLQWLISVQKLAASRNSPANGGEHRGVD